MKVISINTVDREGGAAKVAYQLEYGLKQYGVNTEHFVKINHSHASNVHALPNRSILKNISDNFCNITSKNIYTALQNQSIRVTANDIEFFKPKDLLCDPIYKNADLIHCHNLHGNFFNLSMISEMSKQKPVIWTLHDMWAITGHCSHSLDCNRWVDGCYHCPYLKTYPALTWDNTSYLWHKKREVYNTSRITIVTPCKWLKNKLEHSILQNQRIELVYNGVDTSTYAPVPKLEARKAHNFKSNSYIILYVAYRGLDNSWKGGDYIKELSDKLRPFNNIRILCVGNNKAPSEDYPNITFLNSPSSELEMAKLYSLADVLLYPSIAETFPLTILEAQSCGLPVISFNVGGVNEIINTNVQGVLVDKNTTEDLYQAILKLKTRNIKEDNQSRTKIRSSIVNRFSISSMYSSYNQLYKELV